MTTLGEDREENETLPASMVDGRRPREKRYLEELGRYAERVLTGWVLTGRILAERGWYVTNVVLGSETPEVVQAWSALGWERFVKAVDDDRWRPEASSLSSYFVHLCGTTARSSCNRQTSITSCRWRARTSSPACSPLESCRDASWRDTPSTAIRFAEIAKDLDIDQRHVGGI